eukprot:EG_transcript_38589
MPHLRRCTVCGEPKDRDTEFTRDDWTCNECMGARGTASGEVVVPAPAPVVVSAPALPPEVKAAAAPASLPRVNSKLNPNAAPFVPSWLREQNGEKGTSR